MFDVQNPKKMFSAQGGLHPSGYPQLFIYLCICLYIYLSIFHIYIITARRLVLPGDLQGRSRHVDHDDDDYDDDDDDEFSGGGRIKPLLKNLQWM